MKPQAKILILVTAGLFIAAAVIYFIYTRLINSNQMKAANSYTINDKGIQEIKRHEALSSSSPTANKIIRNPNNQTLVYPYLDGKGVITIGYGHTGSDVYSGLVLTITQVDELLVKDLLTAQNTVRRKVSAPITQNMFNALVSFVFNVGSGNFGSSTLLKVLNKQDYEETARQFHRWIYDEGDIIDGLISRRADESKQFTA
jgi:lysozyme